ncbi:M60 family metallopeptidase [Marinilabiliaceae bacterium ANBcel2]|nr:M60 family metallopeptidase [Marinilabiliaceae bacterium ANBcel2]
MIKRVIFFFVLVLISSQNIFAGNVSYIPANEHNFESDRQVTIKKITALPEDIHQNGQTVQNLIDGSHSSLFHTSWSGIPSQSQVIIDIYPESSHLPIDYLTLTPRSSGANGIIREAQISVKSVGESGFTKRGTIKASQSNTPVIFDFDTPLSDIETIRVKIVDAYSGDNNYYVSLALVELFNSAPQKNLSEVKKLFTDGSFSQLKSFVTKDHINSIDDSFLKNIAQSLFDDSYCCGYRVQTFSAYRTLESLAKELKTNHYNQFENPAGIWFQEGEDVILFKSSAQDYDVSLRVKDFGPGGDDHTYHLSEGINVLEMKGNGNAYINYYTDDYLLAPDVKINFASGEVNRLFDVTLHSNEDGALILDNAVSGILDLKGEYVNLAYSVESLKEHSYNTLKDLVKLYDKIIYDQHEIMGLHKYDRLPRNSMFGRVIWRGFMHADGVGAAFHDNTMGTVANPDNLKKQSWGPAHEFGHVNQTRPGMLWVRTTEVTNNIFSKVTQFSFTPDDMRLEHENVGGTIGGRFNAYLNNAFINDQEWGLQAGPDSDYRGVEREFRGETVDIWGGDFFVALTPMWQLYLFFNIAGEGNAWFRPDIYADVFEAVRNSDEGNLSHGELQMNFVRNVCDAVEMDLSDFFIDIGMLQEVDKVFDDYTSARKTITSSMINEVVDYISQYPKPDLATYIKYISANSYKAYKYGKDIEGSFNKGVKYNDGSIIADHSVWKNATVFKTYSSDELLNITMVGTGSEYPYQYTQIPYPSNATRVEAVGFDGTARLVYGEK